MNVNLEVTTIIEWEKKSGKEVDWEKSGNPDLISYPEYKLIEKILATEVGIYCLRRAYGIDGAVSETMSGMRKLLIELYEKKYGVYPNYNNNNFY